MGDQGPGVAGSFVPLRRSVLEESCVAAEDAYKVNPVKCDLSERVTPWSGVLIKEDQFGCHLLGNGCKKSFT